METNQACNEMAGKFYAIRYEDTYIYIDGCYQVSLERIR